MQDFPFAENEVIVRMIVGDLFRAAWAVPVIAFGVWRVRWNLSEGTAFGTLRGVASILVALGWIGHFAKAWVVPTAMTIDVPTLRADATAFAALGGPGRIGYFDCNVKLAGNRSIDWSARKVYAWRDDDGSRWLWLEGNADESTEIAAALQRASGTLAFAAPSLATIDAWAAKHQRNRIPLMDRPCGAIPANVMLFREPNGYVTPCLLVRL